MCGGGNLCSFEIGDFLLTARVPPKVGWEQEVARSEETKLPTWIETESAAPSPVVEDGSGTTVAVPEGMNLLELSEPFLWRGEVAAPAALVDEPGYLHPVRFDTVTYHDAQSPEPAGRVDPGFYVGSDSHYESRFDFLHVPMFFECY